MIAITPRKPAAAPAVKSPEQLEALAGNGPVDLNIRVLRRIFQAVSANQSLNVAEAQSLVRPDLDISDAKIANLIWLLQDARVEDLNSEHLKSFHRDVSGRLYTRPATMGLPGDVVANVKELLQRRGVTVMHDGRPVLRMGIEQIALTLHMFRLGASTAAIREAIADNFPGLTFDKTRALVREFYDMGPKFVGWGWDTPIGQRKTLPRLAGSK